jgi:hypothetical protein
VCIHQNSLHRVYTNLNPSFLTGQRSCDFLQPSGICCLSISFCLKPSIHDTRSFFYYFKERKEE